MNTHNPGIDRDLTFLSIAGLILVLISPSVSASCGKLILNNTNLAPTIEPSSPGTGERVNGTVYYANKSEIDLHVFAHAMNVSEVAETLVYINGTLVSPRSGRPLGGSETAYRGVDITIPRYSNYSAVFINYHHYEWREYTETSCPGVVYLPGFEGGLFIVSIGLLYTIRRMR